MKNTITAFASTASTASIASRTFRLAIAPKVLCFTIAASLLGCANIGKPDMLGSENIQVKPITASSLGNSQLYTTRLAQALFANMRADKQSRYAVAGFVPVTTLQTNLEQQAPLMLLGHQLEQGLMTEAVRRGFTTQDFKASNAIIMSELHDRALSRNLVHLSGLQGIDYYITGTITPGQNGAMVNARIIDVRNKDVIAAASSFFPADLFWEKEQVSLRNGMLYRSENINTLSNNLE